jgi:hypothetical protein
MKGTDMELNNTPANDNAYGYTMLVSDDTEYRIRYNLRSSLNMLDLLRELFNELESGSIDVELQNGEDYRYIAIDGSFYNDANMVSLEDMLSTLYGDK